MTVTLPRALEVCGVTRSIRCPFKCVPTRASCTARWNPISPHFYILLFPNFAIHCIDLERKGVQGFLGTRSGSESSAQRTRVAPFQRSSSPHMLSPSSTGHHCLKDQYLCSSKYWLLWPCLIISFEGTSWDVLWRLTAFIIEHTRWLEWEKWIQSGHLLIF